MRRETMTRQRRLFDRRDTFHVQLELNGHVIDAYGDGRPPRRTEPRWSVSLPGKETPLHVCVTYAKACELARGAA